MLRPRGTPWDAYRREKQWKLLQPGYGGMLDQDELEYIQGKLRSDAVLSHFWGFKPSMTSRSDASVQRVAEFGSPDERRANVVLARKRQP